MNTETSFADQILNNTFQGVTNVENSDAVNTMLDKFGLNWRVGKQGLYLPSTDGKQGKDSGYKAVVREDNGAVFTTCKESYMPFQNSELSELLIRLSEKTGYEVKGGGMFNGGAKVFLQLDSPNKLTNIGNNRDRVDGYLTGINSHDGSTALCWGESNVTISCQNTFYAAMKEVRNRARHTDKMHAVVEAALRELDLVVAKEKSLFDTFIQLAERSVTKELIEKVAFSLTNTDISLKPSEMDAMKEKGVYTTYQINRAQELVSSISQEMAQKGQTGWGLLSGITHYSSHVMPAPKRENGRTESTFTGAAYRANTSTLELLTKHYGLN